MHFHAFLSVICNLTQLLHLSFGINPSEILHILCSGDVYLLQLFSVLEVPGHETM